MQDNFVNQFKRDKDRTHPLIVPMARPKPEVVLTKPKRPLSAYLRFAQDKRPELPKGITVCDQMKQIAEMWRALDLDEKRVYEQQAQQDKARYNQKCS
jgi:hypothetical protein